jgi:hypothetical protein
METSWETSWETYGTNMENMLGNTIDHVGNPIPLNKLVSWFL